MYDVRSYPKRLIYSTENPEEAEKNVQRYLVDAKFYGLTECRWANDTIPDSAIVWDFPKEKMTVKGDVLVKVYHLPPNNPKKIYLCRFSFHTAFLEGGVLVVTEHDVCYFSLLCK